MLGRRRVGTSRWSKLLNPSPHARAARPIGPAKPPHVPRTARHDRARPSADRLSRSRADPDRRRRAPRPPDRAPIPPGAPTQRLSRRPLADALWQHDRPVARVARHALIAHGVGVVAVAVSHTDRVPLAPDPLQRAHAASSHSPAARNAKSTTARASWPERSGRLRGSHTPLVRPLHRTI